jgi:Na+/H+ antiporter NhaA
MSNRHRTARATSHRLVSWLASPEGFAAAAAGNGEPTPLLALDAGRPAPPSVEPRPRRLEAWTQRTSWVQGVAAPMRAFLGAETGGAVLLALAIAAALIWANSPWSGSYGSFWASTVSVNLSGHVVTNDLRGWINEGLMTLFFLVVGLEAKRELDLGELRDRRRLAVPVLAGLGGVIASTAVYLAVTAGQGGAGGWGTAISTDTALALGTLTLATRSQGNRLRVFLLTVLVIDDLAALVVIAVAYPERIDGAALAAAAGLVLLLLGLRRYGARRRETAEGGVATYPISIVVGFGLWLALFESGVDPVIAGLLIGLLTSAYTPRRARLERGTKLARSFREEPTPRLAYSARASLTAAISPNDRLQYRLHPWTSCAIVPLFALANAGVHFDTGLLSAAATSTVSWGIVLAFVAGKPLGILATAWITAKGTPRAGKLPVSWRELVGTASSAGVGFTVSLLVASRAFDGALLDQAKVGVLATALVSPLLSTVSFWPLHRTHDEAAERWTEGSPAFPDLALDVDPAVDHIRGDTEAPVTLLAYGSFGCRYSSAAAAVVSDVLERFAGRVRYVYRHLPLTDVDPSAQLAAEAVEAAGEQDAFWAMHDRLSSRPEEITLDAVYRAGRSLRLDLDRFFADLGRHAHADRIARDVRSADASNVAGTPTFFIDGRRYDGAFDLDSLTAGLAAALRSSPPVLARRAIGEPAPAAA